VVQVCNVAFKTVCRDDKVTVEVFVIEMVGPDAVFLYACKLLKQGQFGSVEIDFRECDINFYYSM
jgi:hypothetical protein